MIKWKIPNCETVPCRIVEMSPLQFLSKVPSPCREGKTAKEDLNLEGCWTESSIRYIEKEITENKPLEAPILDYTKPFRGFPSHEGRHRAYVAYRLGVKKIPVMVIGGV